MCAHLCFFFKLTEIFCKIAGYIEMCYLKKKTKYECPFLKARQN